MKFNKLLTMMSIAALSFASLVACGNSTPTESADLVVVGAGGAGLAAAVQASQAGVENIIVLEKMPLTGGNTNKATGGMNAAESTPQEVAGIEDSIETMIADTLKGGKDLNDPELVEKLATEAKDGIDWLIELGADLNEVARAGGATNDRIHRPVGGAAVGPTIIKTLDTKAKELGVDIRTWNEATEIMTNEDGSVAGIKAKNRDAEEYIIETSAIVVATGGFGSNKEMIAEYREEIKDFATTNHPGATGDGIKLIETIGGDLVDIEQIQIHPTGVAELGLLISEGVRGDGAILVNTNGERFYNELETRDNVAAAILAQPGSEAYLVFDEGIRQGLHAIEDYIHAGVVEEAATLEELASIMNVDTKTLEGTISAYNTAVETQTDEYGRTSLLHAIDEPTYYCINISPIIHHTMGGVRINTNTEVLDANGDAIEGLFAAGEVTGGVHGANRLGGNAVADIIVFGRQAGLSVAEFLSTK
ncbi:MAG TPA: flavocytochrome c [Firmicutes bacterium]|nr:flavocytochrome c [Bacillota bacterium]